LFKILLLLLFSKKKANYCTGVSYVYKLIVALIMTPAIYGVHHALDTYFLGTECAAELVAKAAGLGPESPAIGPENPALRPKRTMDVKLAQMEHDSQ
jgi:hypothetical protein